MKIRLQHVSNSSTSSYIMIGYKKEDVEFDGPSWAKKYYEDNKKALDQHMFFQGSLETDGLEYAVKEYVQDEDYDFHTNSPVRIAERGDYFGEYSEDNNIGAAKIFFHGEDYEMNVQEEIDEGAIRKEIENEGAKIKDGAKLTIFCYQVLA